MTTDLKMSRSDRCNYWCLQQVANVYMAKAPGKAVDFDGSGTVWFKVFEITAYPDPTGQQYPKFPSSGSHILYPYYYTTETAPNSSPTRNFAHNPA